MNMLELLFRSREMGALLLVFVALVLSSALIVVVRGRYKIMVKNKRFQFSL